MNIFFNTRNPGRGWSVQQNECLFTLLRVFLKLTCVIYRSMCATVFPSLNGWIWLHIAQWRQPQGETVGAGRTEDSVTVWTFLLHPSSIFWLLGSVLLDLLGRNRSWRGQRVQAPNGNKLQRQRQTRDNSWMNNSSYFNHMPHYTAFYHHDNQCGEKQHFPHYAAEYPWMAVHNTISLIHHFWNLLLVLPFCIHYCLKAVE